MQVIDSGHGRQLQDTVRQLLVNLNTTPDIGDARGAHSATTTEPSFGPATFQQVHGGDDSNSPDGKGTKRKYDADLCDHAGRFLMQLTDHRFPHPGVAPPQYDTVSSTTDTETKRQRWERFVAEAVPRGAHAHAQSHPHTDGADFRSNGELPDAARSRGPIDQRGGAHFIDVSAQSPPTRDLTSFPLDELHLATAEQRPHDQSPVKRETESPVCHMAAMFGGGGGGGLETSMLSHAIDSATCDPLEFDQYLYPQHDKPARWQHVDVGGGSPHSADAAVLTPESVDEGAALSPGGEQCAWFGATRKTAPHETPLPCLKRATEAHRRHIEEHMVVLAAELTGQEPVSSNASIIPYFVDINRVCSCFSVDFRLSFAASCPGVFSLASASIVAPGVAV